jgi:predicted nucleotidyltransferase
METTTKEEILKLLTDRKEYLRQTYSVEKIGLFGSYAKNMQRTDSDIDIYVEFRHKTFDNLTGLWDYLEQLYHHKVDLFYKHKRSKGALFEKIRSEVIFG